jgi:2-amino-4-hydroxy-6-hydroxymethyldihydropteridine diphosphokinase
MNQVYLSLGSNRGNREQQLQKAIEMLGKAGRITIASSRFETQPWRMNDETNFINQAVLIETELSAQQMMEHIISIEESMGRVRGNSGYEPRTIDIDILFFNNSIINSPTLTIPHPHISDRRFVLEPLFEIAPNYIHPVLKATVKQLLATCPDNHSITKMMSK